MYLIVSFQTDQPQQKELIVNIDELIGKDLKGFQILEMTEVYRVDDDGRKSVSFGFFKERDIAAAFASVQTDAGWHKTEQAFVLTDGTIGYIISRKEPVKVLDDKKEAIEIKNKIIANLPPVTRKILGFSKSNS